MCCSPVGVNSLRAKGVVMSEYVDEYKRIDEGVMHVIGGEGIDLESLIRELNYIHSVSGNIDVIGIYEFILDEDPREDKMNLIFY